MIAPMKYRINTKINYYKFIYKGVGGGGGGGDSHCKWCANDMTAYSKNNVIFFYKQKIPISPFV